MNQTATSGRRKTAVARVFMTPGSGSITVNQKPFEQYFPVPNDRAEVMLPFETTNTIGQYDVVCNVAGGGVAGQAEAVRLGISKGLVAINEELKPALRAKGLMTRDNRMVERKKPGQKKARKRFQFSKR
ncbi:MAG: 30S ribosomal protein S9 [Flavobacteriaceae bacterium]|nr:30S ribosomal protein S9 [Flavobacteriaceae bacterium]